MTKAIDNFLEPEKFAIIKEIVGGPDFSLVLPRIY